MVGVQAPLWDGHTVPITFQPWTYSVCVVAVDEVAITDAQLLAAVICVPWQRRGISAAIGRAPSARHAALTVVIALAVASADG